jgi:hypothetical protein
MTISAGSPWRSGAPPASSSIQASTTSTGPANRRSNTCWTIRPIPEGDARKAIERYIVMPGQATAYKIGMNKIVELREKAKAELGDKFDIRDFHDVVLKDGAVPLDILEENVDKWIADTKAGN